MARSSQRRPQPHHWGGRALLAAALWFCVLGAPPARAERALTLREAHLAALEANPAIQSVELEPLLAEAEYLAAQGLFDPTVTMNYTTTDRTDPLSRRTILSVQGVVQAVDSTTTTVAGGIGGVVASGTQYRLSYQRTRTDSTINEFFGTSGEYDMEMAVSLTQPVMRNFGIGITTTNLQVADRERQAARARLRAGVIDTLFSVEQAYWQLVLAREQRRVQQNGRGLAERLLEETRVRLEVGVVAPMAVLEAETALARREEAVLLAEQAVGDASDALLRRVSARARTAEWHVPIVPRDAPGLELVPVAMDRVIREALHARPELALLRVALAQARLAAAFQKNQRLPEVNLLGEYGFRSIGLSAHSATNRLFRGKDPHWLLGVQVAVPWGNRAARGAHRRAKLTERNTKMQLRRTEQRIVQDVRSAARGVTTKLQQVEATRAVQRLEEQQLAAEEAKLEVGVATPFDVRQIQDDLIEAQGRALEALIGYRISIANLARAEGRYLQRIGLRIGVGAMEDIAPPPPLMKQGPADAGPVTKFDAEPEPAE